MRIPFLHRNKKIESYHKEIEQKVKSQKNKFLKDMKGLQDEAQDIHASNIRSLRASKKINRTVNDLAAQMAIILTDK